ncbi:hypothetical protein AB1Y20_004363 [Prymnesium parvum]|uniref:RING-type domain-containing protein n=1 Tax=Prymnesium parvum TaxID=97485 RepID=A0AB34IW60_PRYPA
MSDGGAVSMHDDCPVCLQVLFHPTLLPCGHHYCAQCWQRVSDTAAFNAREPSCPVCRSTAFTVQLDTALEAALQQRHPEAWAARAQQHEAELHLKQLCQRRAEELAAGEQAAAEEHEAEEWEEGADGRATRRMTAALVLRCARAQSAYRTARLASKLEMSLLCLRDVSPSLSQYSLLTSLRVEHNAIESFAGLQLPLLKVLVAHHNRLDSLALEGTPRLLLLDVGSNRLTTLAGVEQCPQLAQLTASSNRIGGEGALGVAAFRTPLDLTHCTSLLDSLDLTHCTSLLDSLDLTHCTSLLDSLDLTHCTSLLDSLDLTHCTSLLDSLDLTHCTSLLDSPLVAPFQPRVLACSAAPLLRCEELSTLQLASNQIASVAELSPLAQLRNLRSLVLAPNPVDGAGRRRLLEVLPQLRLLDAIPNHALERAEHREKMRARQAWSTAMMRRIKEQAEAKRAAARELDEPLASPALPPNCGERWGPGARPTNNGCVYTSGLHSRHFEHPAEDVRLSWSDAADAVLAGFVRQACFDFDKAALMMTAWMQGMQQADGNSHAAVATAKQCRLRWAFTDQRICTLATQLEEEWLSID